MGFVPIPSPLPPQSGERVTSAVCALDANQQTTPHSTCPKAFEVAGLHPFSLDVLLKRPDFRGSDDTETAIHVEHPDRAVTGSRELASDAWGLTIGMRWLGPTRAKSCRGQALCGN
jgi:hypothetical protein